MPLTVQVPTVGQANSTEAVKVTNTLTALNTWANGGIASTDVAAAFAQAAGMNQVSQTVKGAVNISASESRTNVAYGTLTTPDQVSGIVMPSNGLMAIWYQALWQESVAGAGRAAIFVGANQLQIQQDLSGTGPGTQAALTSAGGTAVNHPLFTSTIGLVSSANSASTGADATTGQIVGGAGGVRLGTEIGGTQTTNISIAVGGPCWVFAAAGTYTISVQYKSSSGSVTASNRKLWVEAVSFA